MKPAAATSTAGMWPCACVKRDRAGKLIKIRMNARTLARCPVCRARRDSEAVAATGR